MKQIKLSRTQGRELYTLVDDDIYEKLNGKSCRLHKTGYVSLRFERGSKRTEIYLHRYINESAR